MTSSFSIDKNGVVSFTGKIISSSGCAEFATYTQGATSDGSALQIWDAQDNSEIYLMANDSENGLQHLVTGNKINVLGGGTSGNIMVNLETTASTVDMDGETVGINLKSGFGNNIKTGGTLAVINLNDTQNNDIISEAKQSYWTTGENANGNILQGKSTDDVMTISGSNNIVVGNGKNLTVNVDENASRTMILGNRNGSDLINNKAGSGSAQNNGYTYYVARGGSVKINDAGVNLISDVRDNTSLEVNTYGSNAAIFEKDSYTDSNSNIYDLKNYLINYGWTGQNLWEKLCSSNTSE